MSIEIKSLSITIDGMTYTGKVERVEPDRRLILSLVRYADEETGDLTDASGELLMARSKALKAAFAEKFPDAPKFSQTARVFAQFSEWTYVVYHAKYEHVEWAKAAKQCGLINSYILDYDPTSEASK